MYREAKRQNIILKTEFEQKTEKWRGWHEWWNIQIERFRVKSTSPAKQPNHPPQTLEAEKQLHNGEVDKNITDRQDVTLERGDAEVKTEEEYFRTTFPQDVVPARQDTHSIASPETPEIKPSTSIKRTESSKQHPTSKPNGSKSNILVANNSMEEVQQIQDILQTTELQYLQTTSKPEIIEILEIPESPLSNSHRTSLSNETRAISIELSPRPKSAPVQRSRASDSSTPLSTRTSVKKSKKRDYPNMKFFTEDGTDGINPRAPSPVESDNGGLLMAMLESPPPEAPGIAIPISRATRKQSLTTATIPNLKESVAKAGRVRRVIELGSDNEGGEISTPPNCAKKRQKVESEPRLRRQLLSPDLASKNKGRGRYSTSFIVQFFLCYFVSNVRNPGDPPQLGDFMINPDNNQGVSYAFNEVVRGKEARMNLNATSCPDCVEACSLKYLSNWKFYRLYGSNSGAVACNHRGDQHIQQVGKHREAWPTKQVTSLFWYSDFPTEEQFAKDREETEKREAERVRRIAEEAARGNGRWKRKRKDT